MPIILKDVMVFSVDSGEGKNGFFANIVLLNMENKSKLEIFTKDQKSVKHIKEREGSVIDITIELKQNKFGLMFGDVLNVA